MNARANASEKLSLGRFAPVAFGFLLTFAILVVFSPLLKSDFINFDDPHYVTENPRVSEGFTWPNVKWAFTESHSGNWHPLTWMSHMLDCEMHGLRAGGHHFTNILLHALNSLLLFACFRRMTGAFWRCALVAWLFALHPLHVESVAWISERKDVLSTFFGLLSLWFYIRFVHRQSGAGWKTPGAPAAYSLALIAFALSLMSKPMLVTFPFVLLLLDVWPFKRGAWFTVEKAGKENVGKISPLIIEKLPFFALSIVACLITVLTQKSGGAVQSIEKYSLEHRIGNTIISYVRYLEKTFWPTDLAIFYPYQTWNVWLVVAAFLLLLGITVFGVRILKKHPFVAVGWFWFLGMLVPVIGIVQVGEQAMADRYAYVPVVGIFVAVIWAIHARTKMKFRKPVFMAGAAVAVLLAFLTHGQAKLWRDSETLFQHALSVTKENYIAHNTLGLEYMGRGDMDKSKFHFSEAVRIRRNYADPLCNLGTIFAQEGNLMEAKRLFQEALTADPQFEQAHYNLGNLYRNEGEIEAARLQFLAVIEINANNADAHSNLGIIAAQFGDMETAARHFREVTRVQPEDAGAYFNLGLALANLGDFNAAYGFFQTALILRPGFAEAEREIANLSVR
ncbi:MAG: tetratricopeptide repeat protein [Verrucomicrobia bacterium]|nr:tetratricopeptide repeat protein [Verrucomicrobiota bacterium]